MTKKNVLLAITGLAPQVVTETLNGIVDGGLDWPDEVQIITTATGKERVVTHLLTANEGEKTIIEQFCEEYNVPIPHFSHDTIFVIPDANGCAVDDARTCEDQEALANFIVRHVARLCSDDNVQLHASLAGGRKTMTFFLGYAMALFSRASDRLTHVLVDAKYELNPHFYYRTKKTCRIEGRGKNEYLNASEATIVLAEIPYIRHQSHLDTDYLKNNENVSYRELTLFQNGVNEIDEIKLNFHLVQRKVTFSGETIPTKNIYFEDDSIILAFYSMIANQIKLHGFTDVFSLRNGEKSLILTELFLQEMEKIAGVKRNCFLKEIMENDEFAYDEEAFIARASKLTEKGLVRGGVTTDLSATYNQIREGMSYRFFNDKRNLLIKKLKEHFPIEFVEVIRPAQVYDKHDRSKLREYSSGGQQGGAYGLWLKPENISYKQSMIMSGVF